MLSADDILRLQKEQFRHDRRNHSDILNLSKNDRLKHYGLHFCKYVGRLARGNDESKAASRTIVDTVLVSLSAANTLHQQLGNELRHDYRLPLQVDTLRPLADAAGRFADACEKIDHAEEHVSIALAANADIFQWALSIAAEDKINLLDSLVARRLELKKRQFFIDDELL